MNNKTIKTKSPNNFKPFYYIILALIVLFPLIIYYLQFSSFSLSKNLSDWGTFGSYLSGAYTFMSVLALLLLTYIANSINRNIAESQLQQSIYNAYFEQINFLFFDVIKCYKEYEKSKTAPFPLNLKNSLELYKIFVENLYNETDAINSKHIYEKEIQHCISDTENILDNFTKVSNDENDKLVNSFITSKTVLIRCINKNLTI